MVGSRIAFTCWCLNYIYAGKLVGVNDKFVLLGDNAFVVYETGALTADTYKDAQAFGREHRVRTSAIESYGVTKKLK